MILTLALLAAPAGRLTAEPTTRRGTFSADVSILYSMLSFHQEGSLEESIDPVAGRYQVKVSGQGDGIATQIESSGILREGRWAPARSASLFQVKGRESRTQISYDWERRKADYHARGETFFLRRLRVVDDMLPLADKMVVDDAITALLNYRDGRWTPQADGRLHTHIVRRRRTADEGPDDVAREYRAELAPLQLKVGPDPATRKPSAMLDLTRFSSWAREDRPARIVFDDERRPALITGSMILGTSITIRLG